MNMPFFETNLTDSVSMQNYHSMLSDDDNMSRTSHITHSSQSFRSQDDFIGSPQCTPSRHTFNTKFATASQLKPNRNTFRALEVNFQSIKAKRTSFWMLLSEVKLDIVNETLLHEMVYEREVLPGGCHVIAGQDRKDHHVDVAIIAKDSITGTEINVKTEFTAVLFECRMNNPCIIGALHRPPNTEQSCMEELSFKIREQHSDNPRANIWIAGDANLPDNDWETGVISRKSNPCKLVGTFLVPCMASARSRLSDPQLEATTY